MKKYFVIALFLLLTGCYSFNTIQLPPTESSYALSPQFLKNIINQKAEIKPSVVTNPVINTPKNKEPNNSKEDKNCGVYTLPLLPKIPELPLRELAKIDPSDSEALDRIQTQHIAELRIYIGRLKVDIRESHNRYLSACYAHLETK